MNSELNLKKTPKENISPKKYVKKERIKKETLQKCKFRKKIKTKKEEKQIISKKKKKMVGGDTPYCYLSSDGVVIPSGLHL